jgi:hypothetical protein
MSTLLVNNLQSNQANGVITVSSGNVVYSPGSIIQVQSTTLVNTFSAAPNGTWTDVTGMSVTITPRTTNSRVLIIVSAVIGGSGTTAKARLLRNIPSANTVIANGTASGSRQSSMFGSFNTVDGNQDVPATSNFLDSPGSTSPITYKLQINNDNTVTVYLNRSPSDLDSATGGRYISTITAFEVAQ